MSKKQTPPTQAPLVVDSGSASVEAAPAAVPSVPAPVTVSPPNPNPKLMEVDRMTLELAKQRRITALAEAKTALAQSENAELTFKYVVLQLYMKYSLTDADAISEAGDIIKGGALQQQRPPQG